MRIAFALFPASSHAKTRLHEVCPLRSARQCCAPALCANFSRGQHGENGSRVALLPVKNGCFQCPPDLGGPTLSRCRFHGSRADSGLYLRCAYQTRGQGGAVLLLVVFTLHH